MFSTLDHWQPYRRRASLLARINTVDAVLGVAHHNGRIFVAYESKRFISVLSDVPPYDEQYTIEIDGFQRAHDLVVCPESGHMFVANWFCIWRIPADGSTEGGKVAVRRIETDFRPWTLSTKGGLLVVTTCDVNVLFVYETTYYDDDQVPKVIALPCDMFPIHAAITKDRNFVICHVPYSSSNNSCIDRYVEVRRFISNVLLTTERNEPFPAMDNLNNERNHSVDFSTGVLMLNHIYQFS